MRGAELGTWSASGEATDGSAHLRAGTAAATGALTAAEAAVSDENEYIF
jgi:hypothetical protein